MTVITRQSPIVLGEREFPLFKRVSLETTSSCNRACSFCPISTGRRDFPTVSMDDALFTRIIEQLEELEFDGVLQMFLLNEPLLDPKMKARLAEARAALPRVTIYLSTNGDPIDFRARQQGAAWSVERLMEYYSAGATTINLNVYDEGFEQHARYTAIVDALKAAGVRLTTHKYSKFPRSSKMVALTDMRKDRLKSSVIDSFYDRTKEDRKPERARQTHCARTQRHIVVLYDGRVPVCCAIDPTSELTPFVGDLTKQSMREVWNCEQMFKYRYYTQQAKRVLPACDTCNHKMAYPHMVRQVDAPEGVKARWASDLKVYQESQEQHA